MPITAIQARQRGKSADSMYAAKLRKYQHVAQANRFSFLPIIFESTGLVHADTKQFLMKLATGASELKRIPKDVLYSFFMKRLSVCVQVNIASCIQKRVASIASHSGAMNHDPTFNRNMIFESEEL